MNRYPLTIMPIRHTPTNVPKSFDFTTRESMVSDGMELHAQNGVTVPSSAPMTSCLCTLQLLNENNRTIYSAQLLANS